MLTPYSFFVSVLHTLPFSNSILFALFIFFFADWRKDHAVRALLLLFSIHPLLFFLWLNYEMVSVEAPLPILDFFTMSHMILMVPIFYNYVYAVTTGHCMRWKRWFVFYMPLVFLFLAHYVVQHYYGNAPLVYSFEEIKPYWSHPDMIVRFIALLMRISYGMILIIGTYVNYKQYQSDLEKDFAIVSSRSTLNWMFLAIALYITYFLLSIVSYVNGDIWIHLLVLASTIIFHISLAFFGFAHKGVYSEEFEPISQLEVEVVPEPIDTVQYESMKTALTKLCQEDQIWRNSELASTDVIAHLNTNRTYFSQFLKNVYNTNFRTCVNTYRIEEAQKLIRENPDMNMMDIYVQCGFASSSSFNEWFKKVTGKSPSEYRDSLSA